MKILLSAAAFCMAATGALAGAQSAYVVIAPASSDSDPTGALILLVIVGIVVTSSALTGRAKAEKDPYLLPTEQDDS